MSTVREAQPATLAEPAILTRPWELSTAEMGATAQDVADSRSAARWSVQERGWKQLLPELPDDMIALLAPPVVVRAQSITTATEAGPRFAVPSEANARFLAPAPPRRDKPRRGGRP